MGQYISHPEKPGVIEVDVYRGTPADAATYGVTRSRDLGDTSVTYHSRRYLGDTSIGDIFFRTVKAWDEDAQEFQIVGSWQYLGGRESLRDAVIARPQIQVQAAPGQFLRLPVGLVGIYDLNGDGDLQDDGEGGIQRPAVGEVDIDPWTGEPYEDGRLVPAE